MHGIRHLPVAALGVALTVVGCSAPPAAPGPQSVGQPASASVGGRTLVIAIRVEPASIASLPLQSGGVSLTTTRRIFNATLALYDERGEPLGYLAETLPKLDTATWRLLEDGRMETTYRLKAGLRWHDGAPLTARDAVFGWQVYSTPALGLGASLPLNLIEEVTSTDAQTVLIPEGLERRRQVDTTPAEKRLEDHIG